MGADMALLELLEASRECSKQAPFLALAGRDTGWPIAGLSVSAWPEILCKLSCSTTSPECWLYNSFLHR
jgi:hypothetical protein